MRALILGLALSGSALLGASVLMEHAGPPRNMVTDMIERVQPSAVHIEANVLYETGMSSRWTGSGVILTKEGLVLTNWHVADCSLPYDSFYLLVTLADGRTFVAAQVRSDINVDLALIQILDAPDLPAAPLADYEPILGQDALVLGSPLGFKKSVSRGIVSGLEREIEIRLARYMFQGPVFLSLTKKYKNLMQLDAPINPGNSGGPVVDIRGQIIGLVNAGCRGADGMGFAVSLATIKEFLKG